MNFYDLTKSILHWFGDQVDHRPWRSGVLWIVVCLVFAWTFANGSFAITATAQVVQKSVAPAVKESAPLQAQAKPAVGKLEDKASESLNSRIDKLEERERALYVASIEASRKSIDWWFSFLAIFGGLLGVGGALIPYLMARKDKDALVSELEAVRRARLDIEGSREQARTDAAEANQHKQDAAECAQILKEARSTSESNEDEKQKQTAAAQQVLASSSVSLADRLRAQAVEAAQRRDADLASLLWSRVMTEAPTDSNAAFNYAYWLQQKAMISNQPSLAECQAISNAYELAHKLDSKTNPNLWIQSNWIGALDAEAQILNTCGDFAGAQVKWKLAYEKCAQVLTSKPDFHHAVTNLSNALIHEAQALDAKGNLAGRDEKFQLAQELLEEHADMSANGKAIVAYNLACVYSLQARFKLALELLEFCRLSNELPGYWRTDPDFVPLRATPDYQAWFNQHFSKKD